MMAALTSSASGPNSPFFMHSRARRSSSVIGVVISVISVSCRGSARSFGSIIRPASCIIRGMRDFAIELKQRPGELSRVASVLAQHQVTLRVGVALAVGTHIMARVIPSDIEAARRALELANIPVHEGEIVAV